uniref:Uncharacterized protein n=1 Tax=Solanum tuberosum TaxID=4113 RepID=M1BQ83_SOLTU
MGSLICPKPRRPGNINTHSNCLPLRNQAAVFISKGGEELFDLIGKEVIFSFHDYQFTPLYYLIVVYGDIVIAYVFINVVLLFSLTRVYRKQSLYLSR